MDSSVDTMVRWLDFFFYKKDPVLTLPNLYQNHWDGYPSSPIISTEVQGLILGNGTIVLKLRFTLHIHTEGRWPLIWSLHLRIDRSIWSIPIPWILVQIRWCEGWTFLVKTEIQSPHHGIYTGIHNMNINQILQSLWRCKDHIRGHPPSVCMCRVNPYFRTIVPLPETSFCTSALKVYVIWYLFQRFRRRSGGARTGPFFVKTKIQSPHHHICTGIIEVGIKWNLFLIRRCKDYIGGHLPSVYMLRVNPYFRNDVL